MKNKIGQWTPTWSYTIQEGEHKGTTLYSGRYTAVSCIILAEENGVWYVLINKRGKGTPDDQGLWNMPCGYLNNGESATEACSRETAEECGVYIHPSQFKLMKVQTDPKKCNNGNVTLRHICILNDRLPIENLQEGGEQNEVDGIQWLQLSEIDDVEWAFDHYNILHDDILYKVGQLRCQYYTDTIQVQYD